MIKFLTAGGKLNALTRTVPFVGLSKGSTLRNTFLNLQFSYCPLFWMSNNSEINRFHEICLRIIYNDNVFSSNIKVRFCSCSHAEHSICAY